MNHRLSKEEIDEGEMYFCDECDRSFKEAWIVKPLCTGSGCAYSLCTDCLKLLRSKIDRLSLLAVTGINTNEKST